MSFHRGRRHHPSPPHRHHHSSSSSCCCCCCCKSSDSPLQIPSSPTPSSDLLLQALLLLQSSQPPLNPSFTNIHRHHHQPKHDESDDGPSLIRSLTRRVAALESSLSSLSPPQRQPQRQPQPSSSSPAKRRESLKHLAAATIQRCFRRFLARRSKTLRDLKHLASLKSHASSLRSSLSSPSHLASPRSLSRKAMDLLFQLDSIQSSDPMIREGKRSVSRELVRISEFVDKILIREKERGDDVVRVRDGGRRVSFAGMNGGDDCKVFDDLSDIIYEVEETDPRLRRQPEGSCDSWSDGEESPRVANGHSRGPSNGGSGLAAPMPVKMEARSNGCTKKMTSDEEEEEEEEE